jgi:hypothetical protein
METEIPVVNWKLKNLYEYSILIANVFPIARPMEDLLKPSIGRGKK